jgi:hypothetical protein
MLKAKAFGTDLFGGRFQFQEIVQNRIPDELQIDLYRGWKSIQ